MLRRVKSHSRTNRIPSPFSTALNTPFLRGYVSPKGGNSH